MEKDTVIRVVASMRTDLNTNIMALETIVRLADDHDPAVMGVDEHALRDLARNTVIDLAVLVGNLNDVIAVLGGKP
jgi:hypothetical protein